MIEEIDKNLIARCLKGDEKSLEILIKKYLRPVHNFVRQYVGNESDAEEITQEAFVKAWRNLKKFNPRMSRFAILRGKQQKNPAPHRTCSGAGFKTWIFCIAKNTAIDFIRKKKAAPFSDFENEKGENAITENLIDLTPLPAEACERADNVKILNAKMKRLSPNYRQVLKLYHYNQLSFKEIAESLGKPLNTVKSWHRRAIILLKKILSES